VLSVPTGAQQTTPAVKVDIYTGIGGSYGGRTPHDVSASVAIGALATMRVRRDTRGAPVLGLGAYFHVPLDYGTSCLVIIGTPGCIPNYPEFAVATAFVGWDTGRGSEASGFRALVGPSLVRANNKNTVFGLQGRLDASVQPVRHLGLGLWAQATTASPFSSGRYRMVSGGVSLRIQ
jgi:hypothetical protein